MDSWEAWRARLVELRREVDVHLEAAEALAARLAQSQTGADASDAPGTAGVPEGTAAAQALSSRSPEVSRALDHLSAHYERPVRLVELARVAGCSRERLVRAFRRETGSTVHAHLMRLRLARAAREVSAGDKIEAVMLGVGYRGKRNFYQQFKARFGMTPGRYRAALRRRSGEQG